jgi:hypothetical protein
MRRVSPQLNESELELLVSYSISGGEEPTEAVVYAFDGVGIDVAKKPTRLAEWINPDT